MKKVVKSIFQLFYYSKPTLRIREWYLEKQNGVRLCVLGLCTPFVLLAYPFMRLVYNKRLEKEVINKDYIYTLSESGVKFYIPDYETDIMQRYVFMRDDFHDSNMLPILAKKYIHKDDVVLDIGGNIGNHTLYFAKNCNPKKIHTFEPVKRTFEILKKNMELNNLNDGGVITLYNCGLGSHESYADFIQTNKENSGGNKLVETQDGDISVITLDSLQLEQVDFIKIDVEGFEYDVLKGSIHTLERCKPILFLEIFDDKFYDVNELLNSVGYKKIDEPILLNRSDYIYIHSSISKEDK